MIHTSIPPITHQPEHSDTLDYDALADMLERGAREDNAAFGRRLLIATKAKMLGGTLLDMQGRVIKAVSVGGITVRAFTETGLGRRFRSAAEDVVTALHMADIFRRRIEHERAGTELRLAKAAADITLLRPASYRAPTIVHDDLNFNDGA